MAFSGTVSQTVFNTGKVIQSAIRRCKIPAAQISGENIEIAKDQLFLLLGDLANQGVPLWCIEKQLYPLYDGQGALTMQLGVNDVLNSFFRTAQEVTGTVVDTATEHTVEFESPTLVATIGVFWAGAAVPIALERSDDGAVWVTVQTETSTASAGQVTWFDLDTVVASSWFRVRAVTGTLLFDRIYLGNQLQQIPLARMNRDDFTNLTNQTFGSDRVLQFWFDRQIPQPIMHMWPLPTGMALTAQIVAYVHRYIMDVGTLTEELEIPQRWYEAIVSGLARKMAREMVEVDPGVIPQLDKDAAMALDIAQTEERDSSPTNWSPNIRPYTA